MKLPNLGKYQPREAEEDYKFWEHLVGVESPVYKDRQLTRDQLYKWSRNLVRKLACTFCDIDLPNDTKFCPKCREYKGIVPRIAGWSTAPE